MGLGDAKLLALIGAFTGPLGALYALVLGCLGGRLRHGARASCSRAGARSRPGLELEGVRGQRFSFDGRVKPVEGAARPAGRPLRRRRGRAGDAAAGAAFDAAARAAEGARADGRGRDRLRRQAVLEAVTGAGAAPALAARGLTVSARGGPEHSSSSRRRTRYLPFGPFLAIGGRARRALRRRWCRLADHGLVPGRRVRGERSGARVARARPTSESDEATSRPVRRAAAGARRPPPLGVSGPTLMTVGCGVAPIPTTSCALRLTFPDSGVESGHAGRVRQEGRPRSEGGARRLPLPAARDGRCVMRSRDARWVAVVAVCVASLRRVRAQNRAQDRHEGPRGGEHRSAPADATRSRASCRGAHAAQDRAATRRPGRRRPQLAGARARAQQGDGSDGSGCEAEQAAGADASSSRRRSSRDAALAAAEPGAGRRARAVAPTMEYKESPQLEAFRRDIADRLSPRRRDGVAVEVRTAQGRRAPRRGRPAERLPRRAATSLSQEHRGRRRPSRASAGAPAALPRQPRQHRGPHGQRPDPQVEVGQQRGALRSRAPTTVKKLLRQAGVARGPGPDRGRRRPPPARQGQHGAREGRRTAASRSTSRRAERALGRQRPGMPPREPASPHDPRRLPMRMRRPAAPRLAALAVAPRLREPSARRPRAPRRPGAACRSYAARPAPDDRRRRPRGRRLPRGRQGDGLSGQCRALDAERKAREPRRRAPGAADDAALTPR